MANNYSIGRRWEYELRHLLGRDPKTLLVTRTPGSHSCIDVIRLLIDGSVELYQCKSTRIGGRPRLDRHLLLLAQVFPCFLALKRRGKIVMYRLRSEGERMLMEEV